MTYDELINNPRYTEIYSLSHSDIKEMVVSEVAANNGYARVANMYQLAGLLAFMLGGFKAFMPYFVQRESVYLWWLFAGLVFSFTVLIPVHELIHAAAYRYVGARKLSFGMKLRKFLFYVQADKQVLNYRQFKIVALAPVVVVGALSILGMAVFYNQPAFYFFLPVFAFHSLFCAGDFGLLCFFQNRPDQEIFTFDIKAEGKTYFYALKE